MHEDSLRSAETAPAGAGFFYVLMSMLMILLVLMLTLTLMLSRSTSLGFASPEHWLCAGLRRTWRHKAKLTMHDIVQTISLNVSTILFVCRSVQSLASMAIT